MQDTILAVFGLIVAAPFAAFVVAGLSTLVKER